jgi:hypothetical protein
MAGAFRGYLSASSVAMSSPLLTLGRVSSSPTTGISILSEQLARAAYSRAINCKRDREVKGYTHGNATHNNNVFQFSQHSVTLIIGFDLR